jgi:hypothetical protein
VTPVLYRLLTRLNSLNTLLTGTAAALSATVFRTRLIPEQLDYLGVLGSVLGVALFVVIAAITPLAEQTRKRAVRWLVITLAVAVVLLVVVRTNFVLSFRRTETCTCLVGWSISPAGRKMISRVQAASGCGQCTALELLDSGDLAFTDIPAVYGASYHVLKNLYVWSYLAMFVALVSLLGVSEATNEPLIPRRESSQSPE